MSINCTKVDDSIGQQVDCDGTPGYVWATIDPTTKHQLNLPVELKLYSIFVPRKYTDWAERFQNFQVRKDDVWVAGFPKSGTVWIENIVQYLLNGLNFNIPVHKPPNNFFEAPIILETPNSRKLQTTMNEMITSFEQYNENPSPRMFKTHSPPFLLPKEFWTIKPKLIYIVRNPKDVIVSRYHMIRNLYQYKGTLVDLCELFMNDHTHFAPIFDHVFSYWQLRHLDNVLFITYEELSANTVDGMKSISEFLGYSYNDEQLKQLADHLSFKKMRNSLSKEATENVQMDKDYCHCRKGRVGGYQDELSEDMIQRLNTWIADKLKNSDFQYSE